MKDLSILIPVRIDSKDRLENLETCLNFLERYFSSSETIVIEDAKVSSCRPIVESKNVKYIFRKNDGLFKKSHVLNQGILVAKNNAIAIYDVDVIVNPHLMAKAARKVLVQKNRIYMPFNGIWIDVKNDLKEDLRHSFNHDNSLYFKKILGNKATENTRLYSIPSGVVVYNKETLIKIGGFNKKIISYGFEDTEILKRARKLGIYYYNLSGANIIHFTHFRSNNSKINKYFKANEKIESDIKKMKVNKLIEYIMKELAIDDSQTFTIKNYFRVQLVNLARFSWASFLLNRVSVKIRTFS